VRRRFENGEVPAIDTVEALLEVQRRVVQEAEARQALYAATLAVTTHLWDERGAPVDLAPGAVPTDAGLAPEPLDSAAVPRLVALAERQHPDLRKAAGRIGQAAARRRYVGQQVIPFVEGELSALADGAARGLSTPFDTREDFKAGATVRTPLLFLKERGRLNLASQQLEQQRLEAVRLRRDIAVAVRTAVNDLVTAERLIAVQRAAVEQSRLLRDGEQRRFDSGESTLFLVNARERAVLEEELKLVALRARYVAARAELAVVVGEPGMLPGGP
jgi:outer membrane protein TolC